MGMVSPMDSWTQDVLVERILSFGAAANVAARSRSHRTAADYAALHPTWLGLEKRPSTWALKHIKHIWVWVNTCRYIFSGMNIHLPAILMFTRGTRF